MSEPRRAESDDLVVDCRVTTTPAFSSIVEALSARIGEFAGCPAGDAGRLGQAVRLVFERARAAVGGEGEVDLDFRGNGRLLHVDVHCPGPAATALADLQDGDGAARLRALVDRSEVQIEGDGTRCRLTQQIRPASS
ncbi:MAG: hypothetical protein KJ061_06540 [Vicinamibacteraceae bacterium]|nr:hypothetical protein [Vicinamibacteraceae bacterium]